MSYTEDLFREFLVDNGFVGEDLDLHTNKYAVYKKKLSDVIPKVLNQIYKIRIVLGSGNYMVIYKTYTGVQRYSVRDDQEYVGCIPIEEPVYRGLIPANFDLLKDIYHLCLDEIMSGQLDNTFYLNSSSALASQGYPFFSTNPAIDKGLMSIPDFFDLMEKKRLEEEEESKKYEPLNINTEELINDKQ